MNIMQSESFSFELNEQIDLDAARKQFSEQHRVQISDVLAQETAEYLRSVLAEKTKWGLAWQAGEEGPYGLRHPETSRLSEADKKIILAKAGKAASVGKHGFAYRQYAMLDAYLERWEPDHPLDRLLEHLNDQPFLNLLRQVTGVHSIIKAEAQATCYDPGNFLTQHDDDHPVVRTRRIGYVLNLTIPGWKPEWGGYLNFLDKHGNIEEGLIPQFNSLNLFRVPKLHSVSYVPPFAPIGRFAITGWAMDPDP